MSALCLPSYDDRELISGHRSLLITRKSSDKNVLALLHELRICGKERDLERGRRAHANAVETGADVNIYVSNTLISMYAKCGSLTEASRVFHGLKRRDVVSWNVLIKSYVEAGEGALALEIFSRMQSEECCTPDARTFVAALRACSILGAEEEGQESDKNLVKVEALERGRKIHNQATKLGFDQQNVFVGSTLVDMYFKCGSLVEGRRVFDGMIRHDLVSWNALIVGYSRNEEPELALECLLSMQREGFAPDARTLVAAIKSCSTLAEKDETRKLECLEISTAIHSYAAKNGTDADIFVANALVDVYAKCGNLLHSRRVFDKMARHDEVSWNSLMLGYVENGDEASALELFLQMTREGPKPNARSFVAALKSCTGLAVKEKASRVPNGKLVKAECLEKGMSLHSQAAEAGFESDLFVANTLVDMYAKCGSMFDARRVFDKLRLLLPTSKLVVSLSALLLGYVDNGEAETALKLFTGIQCANFGFQKTFVAAVKACGCLADLTSLKTIHGSICRSGLEKHEALGTCLVDAYGRTGSMPSAQQIFDSVVRNDSVSWTALIAGYGKGGDTEKVFYCFDRMRDEGTEVNAATLVCLLAACARGGQVKRGKKWFEEMSERFGVEPEIEHYHCVMDCLGRENRLVEAVEMVKGMPYEANPVSWMTVLDACRRWRDEENGRNAFRELVKLGECDGAGYVVMANLCSS